jgi:hypothetical protein
MWHHVVWWEFICVLEEHSIPFAVCLPYTLTLKVEAVHSSETSVNLHQTTEYHGLGDDAVKTFLTY